jgi:hypothetical protein
MENLKVNDWVMYQGKKRQVAIVNGDGTVRLKSDDPTEISYCNGTIGCFHKNWLSPVIENQTAVEWLVEQLNKQGFAQVVTDEEIKQALEMEKQQIIDAYIDASPKLEDITKESAEQYYQETYKSK